MYESTLVKTPSFWYGLKRPACSGGAKTIPAANADSARSDRPPARRRRERAGFGRAGSSRAGSGRPGSGRRFGSVGEGLEVIDRLRSLRPADRTATRERAPASQIAGRGSATFTGRRKRELRHLGQVGKN